MPILMPSCEGTRHLMRPYADALSHWLSQRSFLLPQKAAVRLHLNAKMLPPAQGNMVLSHLDERGGGAAVVFCSLRRVALTYNSDF